MFFSGNNYFLALKIEPKNRRDIFDGVLFIFPEQRIFLDAQDFNELFHFSTEAIEDDLLELTDGLSDRKLLFQMAKDRVDGQVVYFNRNVLPVSAIVMLNNDLYNMESFYFIPEENMLDAVNTECNIILKGDSVCIGSMDVNIVKDIYMFYETLFTLYGNRTSSMSRMNLKV